jgi:hypothetical protein
MCNTQKNSLLQKFKFCISLILGLISFNGAWTHIVKVTEGSFILYAGIIKMQTKATLDVNEMGTFLCSIFYGHKAISYVLLCSAGK